MDQRTGLPLLSGIAPKQSEDEACRKCNKEFNVIFTRSRACAHCGYLYCHSCTDYSALAPRATNPGYDQANVCAYCVEMLNITAASPLHLKTIPLTKLRKYATAYNISLTTAVEKDDVVKALVGKRGDNGCLGREHEAYYRRYSVPYRNERSRGIFTRGAAPPAPAPPPPPTRTQPTFARPDLAPDLPPASTRPTPPPQPPRQAQPPHPPPRPRVPSAHRPTPPPPPPNTRPTPPPPTPSLPTLFTYSPAQISALSVHTLKAILLDNHVHLGPFLEKEELVSKVKELVNSERAEEEAKRRRDEEERLQAQRTHQERERVEMERALREVEEMENRERDASGASPANDRPMPRVPLERSGICVVCQDEDANIAIVDCGHLALCRACSELVMNSTRECPLCRTHIVSDARLLRIFRT
ncbi:hypothetical protein BDZ89DRAFT_659518 [Hymenopellis radicata]|nr:hypothetical protein BDZ89DRAFT_659518 [Hymenopellis radicata]